LPFHMDGNKGAVQSCEVNNVNGVSRFILRVQRRKRFIQLRLVDI
jgi:hypothetical protein